MPKNGVEKGGMREKSVGTTALGITYFLLLYFLSKRIRPDKKEVDTAVHL